MINGRRVKFMVTKKLMLFGVAFVLLLFPAAIFADSISPTAVTGTLAVGASATIHKTVTVSAGTPTAAQGDVFFLSDTTGSMYELIGTVKTNATAIVTGLSVYGNVQTGAGSYRDVPTSPWGDTGDYSYRLDSAIDGVANTQAGIDTWIAGGGADLPESQLIALTQVATDPAVSFRVGSEKFVVWFGDAPGHEPSNTPGYPGPSTADTITTLQAAGITVIAFDVSSGGLNVEGQAAAITGATGGTLTNGFPADTDAVVAAIVAAIGEAFATYTTVDIAAPSLAGLDISILPTYISGAFDRSVERTFGFDVTFTGLAPGTYEFDLFGRVDGGNVATEHDIITVGVPEPGTLLLLGMGLVGLAGFRKRLFKK
jgi:hypothetical protein